MEEGVGVLVGFLVIWGFFSIFEGPADHIMLWIAFSFRSVAISSVRNQAFFYFIRMIFQKETNLGGMAAAESSSTLSFVQFHY